MDIEKVFTYHTPTGPHQLARYAQLRASAKAFAYEIVALCPHSAEQTLALRYVQLAVMLANAAIAINEAE